MRYCRYLLLLLACLLPLPAMASDAFGAADSAIYEVPVAAGVSYEDVVLSLKVLVEGENFVNPANFPLGEHLKARGQDPGGPLEVHAVCNLSLGAEIMLDHPEFAVLTPDPDAIGVDYAIGELDWVNRGVGLRMLRQWFPVARSGYPDATTYFAAPDHRNLASRRLLLKAGFVEGTWFDEPQPDGTTATLVGHSFDVASVLG